MSSTKSSVQLKGSVDIVVEFFHYGINSILYQRGLYPTHEFIQNEKYGLPVLVTTNKAVKRYLDTVLSQMKKFLSAKNVHKIVIVIIKIETMEPVERWQFDVELEKSDSNKTINPSDDDTNVDLFNFQEDRKLMKEIQEGIRGVIRQITASVTFLPTLEGTHAFDILLYTDKDCELPNDEWSDTNARLINNGEHIQLRGFTTHVHNVEPIVSYCTNK